MNNDVEEPLAGVDERAPVIGEGEVEIDAANELVWDVLTAVDRWPWWNPDVKSVSLAGAVEPGSEFRWKAGPGTIKSTLVRVEAPRLIAWRGKTLGIRAIHFYWLESRHGKTLVRTKESYDGLTARLFRGRLQKTLDAALAQGLRYLKAEAEQQMEASRTAAPRH